MTPQELKNSILQWAIQGRLVEQRAEEGSAKELIEQIKGEKEQLIKNKKIKKEKPLPEIAEDEIPFDIPESWEWVRLSEVCILIDGIKVTDVALPYLEAKYIRGKCEAQIKNSGKFVDKNEFVMLVDGENSGEVFLTKEKGILGSTFKILRIYDSVYGAYIISLLKFYQRLFRNSKRGAAIPHLDKNLFKCLVIGLPPLEEQKRIVVKIEELMPYVEQYEKAYTRLEAFNKKFPEDMQKSILQYAAQGKLIEQRVEEGTAEELYQQIQEEKARLIKEGKIKNEKPLSEIIEDEIPFDIPKNWKWVRLLDILVSKPTNGYSPKSVNYETKIKNLTLTATTSGIFNENAYKYVDIDIEDNSSYWLKKDDLLIQRSNSREYVGTSCIYIGEDNAFIYPDLIMRMRVFPLVSLKYIDYILKAPFVRKYFKESATGTSQSMPKINQGTVCNTLIPLPPLGEQKRIVARIEEMLPYCKQLIK